MRTGVIDCGLASRIMSGAQESGDLHVIHEFPGGLLIGALDGLGHGPEAAVASRLCASLLTEYAGEPLEEIIARCHVRLRGTRGTVLSLCTLNEKASTWSWMGVGNVSGVLQRERGVPRRERKCLIQTRGVVGGLMSKVNVSTIPLTPGDVMVLATDGVRADYSDELDLAGTPQQIAERILDRHATGTDDALALVARYGGGSP